MREFINSPKIKDSNEDMDNVYNEDIDNEDMDNVYNEDIDNEDIDNLYNGNDADE